MENSRVLNKVSIMKKTLSYIIGSVIFLIVIYNQANAAKPLYATISHPKLTKLSLEYYRDNDRRLALITNSNILNMEQGSNDEDSIGISQYVRSFNHYYDYFHSNVNGGGYLTWDSAKKWAHDNTGQSLNIYGGVYTWEGAINSYKIGDVSSAFLKLGHILHLIQDMCVPTHTRNDSHFQGSMGYEEYEDWVNNWIDANATNIASAMLSNTNILEFNGEYGLDDYFDYLSNYTQRNYYSGYGLSGTVGSVYYSEDGTPSTIFPRVIYCSDEQYTGKYFKFAFGINPDGPGEIHLAYRAFKNNTWEVWSAEHPVIYQDTWERAGRLAMRATAGVVNLFLKEISKIHGSWSSISINGAPSPRSNHSAVWTGSEMIVWGGADNTITYGLNDGKKYNPFLDIWGPMSSTGAPSTRFGHSAIWTGTEMLVYGGGNSYSGNITDGGRYKPSTDSWISIPSNGETNYRIHHSAIWTGSHMIIWGGKETENPGWKYNPLTNTWAPISSIGAPLSRFWHSAIWTGAEMIIWGGTPTWTPVSYLNSGSKYNPATDTWTSISIVNAPTARTRHTAIWTGSDMIVWGGQGNTSMLNTGARYNPSSNTWSSISTINAPIASSSRISVWTGTGMIVFGGNWSSGTNLNIGGTYYPISDTWQTITVNNSPLTKILSTSSTVWTGNEMIVWGGQDLDLGGEPTNNGSKYIP